MNTRERERARESERERESEQASESMDMCKKLLQENYTDNLNIFDSTFTTSNDLVGFCCGGVEYHTVASKLCCM